MSATENDAENVSKEQPASNCHRSTVQNDLAIKQCGTAELQPYFYPEYRQRHGYGHMARMVRLRQRFFPHAPFVINCEDDYRALRFIAGSRVPREQCVLWEEIAHRIPLLVVDVPLCKMKTVMELKRRATIVIGIDGRGSGARLFDYIIDLLPRVGPMKSNLRAYSLMPLHIGVKGDSLFSIAGIDDGLDGDNGSNNSSSDDGMSGSDSSAVARSDGELSGNTHCNANDCFIDSDSDDSSGCIKSSENEPNRNDSDGAHNIHDGSTIGRSGYSSERHGRCLIYFNGRQRKRLIKIGYAFAVRRLHVRPENISHILLNENESVTAGQHGMYVGNRLSHCLDAFSTVITLVGVTALEASLLHKSVYLINPSSYHDAISTQLGLTRQKNFMNRRVFSATYGAISSQGFGGVADRKNYDFSAIVDNILSVHPSCCPNCNATLYRHHYRSPARALVSCVNCELRFFRYFVPDTISYQHGYFTDDYKKRYGAQYTEQQQQLEGLAHDRLQKIHRFARASSASSVSLASSNPSLLSKSSRPTVSEPKRLLDIGCAYGTFLSIAKQYDYRVYGVELNIEAAESTRQHHQCLVATSDFTTLDVRDAFGVSDFDIITLWYVIEHIVQLSDFIQKIWEVTKQGGVVAMATPNPRSILDLTVPDYTAMTSPREHYAVLSVKCLRKLLQAAGFKVVGVWNHGIHPEYYPTISPKIATLISNTFRLGTTYTMFAERPAE